ncbi:hypothetical protein CP965_07470 [Halarcobacter mediterraneus]|uniref:Prepilin-type cleavage/methylation domain-containing protein n=1 Tax=Halarcobacter mediterraneus TaxID=2023153 RepID=A0A4Q1B1G0_9BACT|nr:type II secretion system protein [Halarcobacter mediterraneus]RXK12416.1 hypothetical protein CP965_07470 [Halarcobacter mediterraneus]
MKNSFSLIETIVVIFLILLISSMTFTKIKEDKLTNALKRLELYIKQTRYQSLIDNKNNLNDSLWHKKRWTLKFFNCKEEVGGLYYVIYSDTNKTGHPNQNESLIDPLTKKRVYTTNNCNYHENRSKYVLLTKEFNIKEINMNCNSTSTIGQISFGSNGKVYTKLSTNENEFDKYELINRCEIKFTDKIGRYKILIVEAKTGYSYIR